MAARRTGQGGRALRLLGHPGQPRVGARADPARAGGHPRRRLPHLQLRGRGAAVFGGVQTLPRQDRARLPRRPAQVREHIRPEQHPHPDDRAGLPREHPQPPRRDVLHAGGDRGGGRRGARAAACPSTSTARGSSTPPSPSGGPVADFARPVDSLTFCLSKGLGAPGRLAGVRLARLHRPGPAGAQDARRRHAPGRGARRGRARRARHHGRPARRGPRERARAWPRAWRSCRGSGSTWPACRPTSSSSTWTARAAPASSSPAAWPAR